MTMRPDITLPEFVDVYLDRIELDDEEGAEIYNRFRDRIQIDFPAPPTQWRWRLRSLGWVGLVQLGHERRLVLEPKIPLGNLFRMLEYAYRLKSFDLHRGTVESASLDDLYQRLAGILARRVLDRNRKGFYRAYIPESDRLPYLRGTLDIAQSVRAPWSVDLHCHYQEHTADVEENQILAWALDVIARQGICRGESLDLVRAAWRALHGSVTLRPFGPSDCVGRLYNRLNEDYRPLHALCRFFLEHGGPSHETGDRQMLPFMVNMGRLYELFVAEWLKLHLPDGLRLIAQEVVSIEPTGQLRINIDLVLYDAESGRTIAVLDTKYKKVETPSQSDLNQIVAYAVATNCRQGALVYPIAPAMPFNGSFGAGHVEVRTLVFALENDLAENGRRFLTQLESLR
jgi:5-methylcytosine-specific restriction enzyme subunit McrC